LKLLKNKENQKEIEEFWEWWDKTMDLEEYQLFKNIKMGLTDKIKKELMKNRLEKN